MWEWRLGIDWDEVIDDTIEGLEAHRCDIFKINIVKGLLVQFREGWIWGDSESGDRKLL